MLLWIAIVACSLPLACVTGPVPASTYVAAVYEHNLIQNLQPEIVLSRHDALKHMQKNLDIYKEQAARAAQQGAQILVFPEVGLQGFNFNRTTISGYLETIPDPEQESWNPCTEPGRHNDTEVLQQLSCMARRNNLYIVANMPDLQRCPMKDEPPSSCPPDGHWQFNTNVAFRSDGLLVARYHKENPFFEAAYDIPPQTEIIEFDTPFAGKFGLTICFDILFFNPTVALVEKGVRQLVFPTAWMNLLPLLDSVQFQQAFSLGANVTLLAANLRYDEKDMRGSGIYTPFSATYHHSKTGEPEEGKLLVARVPVLDPLWLGQSQSTEKSVDSAADSRPSQQENSLVPPLRADFSIPPSPHTFISTMMFDPFTFVALRGNQGQVKVCNGSFCCYLQYRHLPQGNRTELYALGAFDGLHVVDGRYYLQICALVRCGGLEPSSCGQKLETAETRMDFLLKGKFETKYVYPSVLTNQMGLEQPDYLDRAGDGTVIMKHSKMKTGLVTACLYGRVYERDDQ